MLTTHDYFARAIVEEGLVDQGGMTRAAGRAAEQRTSLEQAIIDLGLASPKDLTKVRAGLCECPFVDLDQFDINIHNAAHLPRALAERHQAFPLFCMDGVVTVGMADALNLQAIDQLRQALKADLDPVLCVPSALAALIGKAYSLGQHAGWAEDNARPTAISELTTGDEPVVAAVNQILNEAIAARASDVHLSPCEHELQLRLRIDGVLQPRQGPPLSAHPAMVQRLKVMADLDLTQTRRPQDGKFRINHHAEPYEVRLSTIPTVCGENVVMRLLRPHGQILGFEELGMDARTRAAFEELLSRPYGMALVTGPTGSGKTSTLYTAIKHLNAPGRNIVTIEDPVEIRVHGIRQVQANPEIGMTFAGALRSILRQDPDIILVGEIRDGETALIATQASLTGHLVLSTLHTNDAPSAVARLKDLGVPPFVINASLLGVVAQRLVRKICPDCAAPRPPGPALRQRFRLGPGDGEFVHGTGCARCGGSGYRGRIGIYELMGITPALAERIEAGDTTRALAAVAERDGMAPMWRDGLLKASARITTLEEVARAVATLDAVGVIESAPAAMKLSA